MTGKLLLFAVVMFLSVESAYSQGLPPGPECPIHDLDCDGFLNEFDNCPWEPNILQDDWNEFLPSNDGLGDACSVVGSVSILAPTGFTHAVVLDAHVAIERIAFGVRAGQQVIFRTDIPSTTTYENGVFYVSLEGWPGEMLNVPEEETPLGELIFPGPALPRLTFGTAGTMPGHDNGAIDRGNPLQPQPENTFALYPEAGQGCGLLGIELLFVPLFAQLRRLTRKRR